MRNSKYDLSGSLYRVKFIERETLFIEEPLGDNKIA